MVSKIKKGFIIHEDTMSGSTKGVVVAEDKDTAYGKLARGLKGKVEVVKSGWLNGSLRVRAGEKLYYLEETDILIH